jgi:transposase InsO family protein
MSGASVRVGVGTRFAYDGEVVRVEELFGAAAGVEVLVCDGRGRRFRLPLRRLLDSQAAQVIADGPGVSAADADEPAAVVLAWLDASVREQVSARAAHVREVLTGFRSGSPLLAAQDEPRPAYAPGVAVMARYEAKAAELGVGVRTLRRWVRAFHAAGEAGLARPAGAGPQGRSGRVDERWVQAALEVMVEHTDASKPSRTMVIERATARVVARFGEDAVGIPSRATAFRVLQDLERRHPTFRLSSKRNRDIADRPQGVYGKLRPTRPGEYMLMDTTRLDVFAMDPLTLRWVQAEVSVSMDWYDRCITGLRVTPVSTKAVDACSTLFQAYRPPPAPPGWPVHAVWPEHGVPRAALIDPAAIDGPIRHAAGPAIVPETLVVDHGRIYVSEHLTSVCQRLGISIQPARLRTGRDKGPIERFFRTLREDLLQALPGYKGPDLHSRGLDPEKDAFFYLDELEAIIREWVATVYHHRPHSSLVDPGVPGLRMSPAQMFEHGVARAGYIEAPRDPDLAYEFLKVAWRTIQPYGIEVDRRRYNGAALKDYHRQRSPYRRSSGRDEWPFAVDPDDITRIYFRDPEDRRWRALQWEHAPSLTMPLSEEALAFARRLAAAKYTYPNDTLAMTDLLHRWNLGLGATAAERRMALRMSREQAAFDLPAEEGAAASLPSVRKVLDAATDWAQPDSEPLPDDVGDDDGEDQPMPDDDFYADALEDV